MLRRLAVWGLVAAACSPRNERVEAAGGSAAPPPTKPSFTLFALAEVRGQIGPCGCTSDPLGDISRTAQLVADARAQGPVMVVDSGSLLYSQVPVPPHLSAQEELKADLLADIYQNQLEVAALGIGPADLALGKEKLRLPRIAANFAGATPGKIEVVGNIKVGVFGIVAPDAVKVPVSDPIPAGREQIAQLRAQGAQVVIALVQAASKKDAVRLIRDLRVDFAVAGLGSNAPEPDATEMAAEFVANSGSDGGTWLVVPANRGQIVSRIEVFMRGSGPLSDAIGPAAGAARLAAIDKELARRDQELASFASDRTADAAFVAIKKRERAKLSEERARLATHPLVVPIRGSYFTLDQVRISKRLACSVPTQSAVTAFFAAAGQANVKAAAGKQVAQPKPGQPKYVGGEACGDCHGEAVEFWSKTPHAHAWKTLVDRGQQFDYDCIGCHITGFDKPGGSNLAHNESLRDVQCETCHGPGSIHVAKGGEEKPAAVWRAPPDDLCATQCHTREHSDTFERTAYLRDILGPGHGEALRKKLGDGDTGAKLRKAALDKAGRALGPACLR